MAIPSGGQVTTHVLNKIGLFTTRDWHRQAIVSATVINSNNLAFVTAMSSLEALSALKTGRLSASNFKSLHATRRAKNLRLSNLRDIEDSHSSGINSLHLEKIEGRYLLSGAADGNIHIHDLFNFNGKSNYTCKTICKIDKQNRHCHKYSVECVQWYPFDTGMFLSSGMDRSLKVWDTNQLKPAEVFRLEGKIYHHHMSPNAASHNLVALATTANQVFLADLRTGSTAHELRNHKSSVLSVMWSPYQEYQLASGSMDNRLLLWDVRASRNCLFSMDQHNGRNNPNIEQTTAHNGYVHGLSFTSDGLFLISVGTDCRMRLWNAHTGRNEMVNYGKISMESKKGTRFDVSSDTDPRLIFVPSQGNILVYDLTTGLKQATLLGHYNTVTCCVYCDNNQTVYSGANDRNILVWSCEPDMRDETLARDGNISSKSIMPRRPLTEDNWSSDDD